MENQPKKKGGGIEVVDELGPVRERRRKEFEELMQREPELESKERYRNGKRKFYGDMIFAVAGMTEDKEDFSNFCEKVLTEDDENLQYHIHVADELLGKIPDSKLKEEIRWTIYSIIDLCGNFYIPLGAFFGQNYTVADPDVQQEINDVGKLLFDERVFPLVAKGTGPEGEASAPAEVIPTRIKGAEKVIQEKKKLMPEKGILTIEGAAARVGASPSWVYKKVSAKIIPHFRIGGLLRFSESEINNWMKSHHVGGCQKI